jgi:hypothetical protein
MCSCYVSGGGRAECEVLAEVAGLESSDSAANDVPIKA